MKRARRQKRAPAHKLPKPRNPVARSPLLAKGGVHDKSNSAKRRQSQVDLERVKRDPDFEPDGA